MPPDLHQFSTCAEGDIFRHHIRGPKPLDLDNLAILELPDDLIDHRIGHSPLANPDGRLEVLHTRIIYYLSSPPDTVSGARS